MSKPAFGTFSSIKVRVQKKRNSNLVRLVAAFTVGVPNINNATYVSGDFLNNPVALNKEIEKMKYVTNARDVEYV